MTSQITKELMLDLYKSYLIQQNMDRIKGLIREKQKSHITKIDGEWNVWKLVILAGGSVSIGCHPISCNPKPST